MRNLALASASLAVLVAAGPARAASTTLTIESWRNDDLELWRQQIIPTFERAHPDIKVVFAPTAPTAYDAALNSKLDAGTAGDIIACRPFDASLSLFKKGELAPVNDIPGVDKFSAFAKSAWTTDDAKTTFCVPVAAVIHGFIYNKDAFDKLGLKPPTTTAEFFAMLDKIKTDGTYIPLDIGTKDQWEAATMGYQNVGPTYWRGEEGRKALIAGKEKLTDPEWVEPFQVLAKWAPYMGDGYKAQSYPDSQNLFTLGRAAIYPSGSWEIAQFDAQAQFKMGAFPPPVQNAGETCYISDHVDIGFGMNAKSTNAVAARTFLAWVASPEFGQLYSDALPGFYSLQSGVTTVRDPLAREFLSWRGKCESTIRSTYQILSRGTPNLENETWVEAANVMNGTDTPRQAAEKLQKGLDSWFHPAQ